MQVTRKIAAAAAVATVATLGLATVVSANMIDDNTKATSGLADATSVASKAKGGYGNGHGKQWYFAQKNGGLVAISQNNVGPFQACDNQIPINVGGVQVPIKDVIAIIGVDQNANQITAVKTCELDSKQTNSVNSGKWYRAGTGTGGGGGVIAISQNNVGPFQACHNQIPINVLGAQLPISDLIALLGIGQNGNSITSVKTCELNSEQTNSVG